MKPLVIVTEPNDPGPTAWLREHARVIEMKSDDARFFETLADAEGLVIRTYTRVNDELLDRAPKLKVVGRGGVGIENIDVPACRRRGVEVVYTPDANSLAVGDFVFGNILQLLRAWPTFREMPMSAQEFKRVRNQIRGKQLNELTMGIIGMGKVGRRVGHIAASGFGMKVIYRDIVDVAHLLDFPATAVGLNEVFGQSDIVTLHTDMRPGNENLAGRQQIARMKPSAILLNCSRGEVLDVHALADAIREKRIAGAAVDVFAPEPPGDDYPLLGLDNVILTPHIASRTTTAMENMSWVVRDIVEVLNGRKPKYPAP
jgi:phosphoglycerate dehydrogenase-like enzyme